ncbi:MAG: CDP-glycerol glycerophosphotransferase family protein [Fibrobacter sp.]|nr:CDP-glycerol glycerophosphotransferase family protein [Fibrobacter sp.]
MSFLLGYPFDFLHAMCFRCLAPLFAKTRQKGNEPWIVGGHRGRIYEDNSSAVHQYIVNNTNQKVVWISANPVVTRKLKAQGCQVLRKNSFKARLAILKAPVFIYSHGEDDIDQFFKYFRKCAGLRIHLNHGLSFAKTGYFAVPGAEKWSEKVKRKKQKQIADFDYMLVGSEYEKEMLARSFPFRKACDFIPDCGCAHVDRFITSKNKNPDKRFLWMPTYRDDPQDALELQEMKLSILNDKRLQQYLEETGATFTLIDHINSGRSSFGKLHPRMEIRSIDEIGTIMPTAQCLISDYSSLVMDWLIFERPFIRFAFDIKNYTRKRSFYIPLNEITLGKDVSNAQELVQHIVNGDWADMTPYRQKNDYYRNRIFPNLMPTHAEICYMKIAELSKKWIQAQ